MKRKRALDALVIGLVCGAGGLSGCGSGDLPMRAREPRPPRETTTTVVQHYHLRRQVFEVVVSQMPVVRTRCWLSRGDDVALLEWDPASPATPPRRRVVLRAGMGHPELRCASENLSLSVLDESSKEREPTTSLYTYQWNSGSGAPMEKAPVSEPPIPRDPKSAAPKVPPTTSTTAPEMAPRSLNDLGLTNRCEGPVVPVAKTNGTWAPLAKPSTKDEPDVVFAAFECGTDPQTSMRDLARFQTNGLAQPRSIEPLAAIGAELATVIADVVIDRAKAGALRQVKDFMSDKLCTRLTRDVLANFLPATRSAEEIRLLPRTCNVITATRVEELAASSKAIERALAADLVNLSTQMLTRHLESEASANADVLGPLLDRVDRVLVSLIDGRAITSERDVQLLLLELASVGVPAGTKKPKEPDGGASPKALNLVGFSAVPGVLLQAKLPEQGGDARANEWRCLLEAGFAVLTECIQRGECTAERLQSSLESELAAASKPADGTGDGCGGLMSLQSWPELPSLLVRSIDVLRPPPGTSANTTAKGALNIFFDVLDHVLRIPDSGGRLSLQPLTRQRIDLSRQLANAVLDKDVAAALISAASFVTTSIAPDCATCDDDNIDNVAAFCANFGTEVQQTTCEKQRAEAARIWAMADDTRAEARKAAAEEPEDALALTTQAIAAEDAVRTECRAIKDESGFCDEDGKVKIRSVDARKAFALLNGFISYSSTYMQEAPSDDPAENAERERLRHEERKKAMESLIASVTDRTGRGGDWVFSAGVGVGLQSLRWPQGCSVTVDDKTTEGSCDGEHDWTPNLSLPMGIAVDRLPRAADSASSYVGWHFQLSMLDIAQYASFSREGEVAEPKISNAALLDFGAGMLIGTPETSVLLGIDIGYAPGLSFETTTEKDGVVSTKSSTSMIRGGFFLGTYIPLWDFN